MFLHSKQGPHPDAPLLAHMDLRADSSPRTLVSFAKSTQDPLARGSGAPAVLNPLGSAKKRRSKTRTAHD
eukprot:8180680-Alexandrium_andersonii.AAC.1